MESSLFFTRYTLIIIGIYLFSLSSILVGVIYPSQNFINFISSEQTFTSSNIVFNEDVCVIGTSKFDDVQIENEISIGQIEANNTFISADTEIVSFETNKLILNSTATIETNNLIVGTIRNDMVNVDNTTNTQNINVNTLMEQNGVIQLNGQTNFSGDLNLDQFSAISDYIVVSNNTQLSAVETEESTWSPTVMGVSGFTGSPTATVARYFRLGNFVVLQIRIEGFQTSTFGSRIIASFTLPIDQTAPTDDIYGSGSGRFVSDPSFSNLFCSDLTGSTNNEAAISAQFNVMASGNVVLDTQCYYEL